MSFLLKACSVLVGTDTADSTNLSNHDWALGLIAFFDGNIRNGRILASYWGNAGR